MIGCEKADIKLTQKANIIAHVRFANVDIIASIMWAFNIVILINLGIKCRGYQWKKVSFIIKMLA